MRRVVRFLGLLAAFAGISACAKKSDGPNPIDVVMEPKFTAENITPQEAARPELCRRLAADLLGRTLTADEAAGQCGGSVSDIVKRFQSRPEYLRVSQRNWRDRFNSSDVNVDWRYLKDLFAQVDRMQRGQLGYKEFAMMAMAHPGFIQNEYQPEKKVKIVFRAFAGRSPTATEEADLAALYRPWLPAYEADPDFAYLYHLPAKILPALCTPLTSCTATMFGGGALDLSSISDPNYQGVKWEDLDPTQKIALEEPGRLLTAQPFFWEAAADEILNRYLAWSDGGRFPREPGIVLPEVREALAEYLKTTNNYPAAERAVLTSWLYRQAAQIPDDGQGDSPAAPIPKVYEHGPVKAGAAEVWLDSTAALTVGLGACDQRYADGFAYFQILNAIQNGQVSSAQGYADIKRLYDMRQDQMPWDDTKKLPDFTYTFVARLIGGCPGFQSQRQSQTGLSYAFTQESLAELLCAQGVAQHTAPTNGDTSVGSILTHQMRLTLGRDPTDQDKTDYTAASAACSGAECSSAGLENSVCVGLLGSAEMVFY